MVIHFNIGNLHYVPRINSDKSSLKSSTSQRFIAARLDKFFGTKLISFIIGMKFIQKIIFRGTHLIQAFFWIVDKAICLYFAELFYQCVDHFGTRTSSGKAIPIGETHINRNFTDNQWCSFKASEKFGGMRDKIFSTLVSGRVPEK